ncbi:HAD family hydrolase [Actinosynnema sp. NPDC023587]|uniref:HAD family hydrolase n=1 Tax=Actinosynnema sp. NPDC023587 TaxID=3154695 RepID=UPI0033EFAE2F
MRVEEFLAERDHVLVAFDGPIAELPPAGSVADRLRVLVAEGGLSREVRRTDDPFEVLAHAAEIGPATARAVYAQLCRIEHELVAFAEVAPGVRGALAAITRAGTHITAVTGLDPEAARTFLVLHGLSDVVRHVVGRAGPDGAGLPPAPDLVALAVHERAFPVGSCAFVGGTGPDLAAARAAGVEALRYRRAPDAADRVTPPNPWFDALSAPTKR